MVNETGFLRAILDDPSDHTSRLVYSDWLLERGDTESIAKAELLRLTVELATGQVDPARRVACRQRLQELAADLDTDWLPVVSQLAIENCAAKRAQHELEAVRPIRFDFPCDRQWADLEPTDDAGVRFCDACKEQVHYCDTIIAAREHAWAGHCIAVDLGVIRREGDLAPRRTMLGNVTPAMIQREEERRRPDPVSERRSRRTAGEDPREIPPST